MMKKSTFGAILAFLFAAAGALTAAALYLRRREKELDEYERLLYSDDGDDYDDDDEYLPIDNEPTEAAEEKAADGTASRKVKMAGLRPGCSCFLQSVVILIK